MSAFDPKRTLGGHSRLGINGHIFVGDAGEVRCSSKAGAIAVLCGMLLEERDLITFHGRAYVEYQKRVSMILPLPPKS